MIHTHTHATVGEALSCHAQLVNRLPAYEAAVEKARLVSQWHGSMNSGPLDELDAELGELAELVARLREGEPSNVR